MRHQRQFRRVSTLFFVLATIFPLMRAVASVRLGPEVTIADEGLDARAASGSGHQLVVWTDAVGGHLLAALDGVNVWTSGAQYDVQVKAVVPGERDFLIVFAADALYGTRIAFDGTSLDAEPIVLSDPATYVGWWPTKADGVYERGGYTIVWSGAQVAMARLADHAVIDRRTIIESNAEWIPQLIRVFRNGDDIVVAVSTHARVATDIVVLRHCDVRVATVRSSGIVSVSAPIFSDSDYYPLSVGAERNGDRITYVWATYAERTLWIAQSTIDGRPLLSASYAYRPVNPGAAIDFLSLVRNGTEFVATWTEAFTDPQSDLLWNHSKVKALRLDANTLASTDGVFDVSDEQVGGAAALESTSTGAVVTYSRAGDDGVVHLVSRRIEAAPTASPRRRGVRH